MNIYKNLSIGLTCTTLVALYANAATAASISVGGTQVPGQGSFSNVPGAITVDFDDGEVPTSGLAIYSDAPVVQGTVFGGQKPDDDDTPYLDMYPTKRVDIDFTKDIKYFGLYWGSVDSGNTIEFYQDNVLLDTFSGTDVLNAAGQTVSNGIYANFFADANESFDKVVLKTGLPFESDNHAYKPVPEPLTILGSATALGFGALLKRQQSRKQKKS
ncbi:PEP-CTERM sorting domain-containing protein [Coleofasciculus chthonoplastes]|uniref:PEP-CTERM sorting domain-containing protein n=1 Tax=Coleofasciculus chthonoplastes TaxID=64178 RepID=UPI0032FB1B04